MKFLVLLLLLSQFCDLILLPLKPEALIFFMDRLLTFVLRCDLVCFDFDICSFFPLVFIDKLLFYLFVGLPAF